MVTEKEVEDAYAVEKAARQVYIEAKDRRQRVDEAHACEKYNVGIGKFVTDKRGRKGVVIRVLPWSNGRPWIYAKEIKKDGSQGKRELAMYCDWTVL